MNFLIFVSLIDGLFKEDKVQKRMHVAYTVKAVEALIKRTQPRNRILSCNAWLRSCKRKLLTTLPGQTRLCQMLLL
jgi:Trp operon repressor